MYNASETAPACTALLDDGTADAACPGSRLYTGYAGSLSCARPEELPLLWRQVQQELCAGKHALGIFTYELGEQMHGISPHEEEYPSQVLLFRSCKRMNAEEADAWLEARQQAEVASGSDRPPGVANLRASVSKAEFVDSVQRIQAYIAAGDTYQVNYTYRLLFDAYGSPLALYRKLRARQRVPYGAYIGLPDGRTILSFSPELFVRHENRRLIAQPMKGTLAASDDPREDQIQSAALAADPKNRAENLMIVDLLRNDLGRVALPGSVQVPRLFRVERHGSVLQMTSTISATPREDATLETIFGALYPCGSITGAPKRRTMQIIRELESRPRGIYTGAIGWFDAPSSAARCADFCLSVPIRTLVLGAPDACGVRPGEMGVGAGIVHDSRALDEYAECRLKARFLTGLSKDFELFETMHASKAEGCRHLALHLKRLRTSAQYFGFPLDEARLRVDLQHACEQLATGAHRLRLALREDGSWSIKTAPLMPLSTPVRVVLAPDPTRSDDLFLRHKTSARRRYDDAWQEAEKRGAFDMLFCNEAGELTEGGRSNVFVKLGGRWYTPPLKAGLLPGVMRSVLLADPALGAREQSLSLEALSAAEQVIVCNALRGALAAQVDWH